LYNAAEESMPTTQVSWQVCFLPIVLER